MPDSDTDYGRSHSTFIRDDTELLSWLGVEIESLDEGTAVLALPYTDRVVNAGSAAVHGGAVATLIDNAAGTAVRTVLSNPETADYATADLNVSYLRPATSDLRATAEIRRAGSSMAVIQVDVDARHEGTWKTVAIGRVSYFIISDE